MATLVTIHKLWNLEPARCPLMEEWVPKRWFIHTAECFPDLKKTLSFEGKYTQPDMIILCEYFMIKSISLSLKMKNGLVFSHFKALDSITTLKHICIHDANIRRKPSRWMKRTNGRGNDEAKASGEWEYTQNALIPAWNSA